MAPTSSIFIPSKRYFIGPEELSARRQEIVKILSRGDGDFAIEEAGKEPVLRSVALARNAEELKISWKNYRTHKEKNRLLAVPNFTAWGAKKIEDYMRCKT